MALGASEERAHYAEEKLAAGNVQPLLRMLLCRALMSDVLDEQTEAGELAWVASWRMLGEQGFPFIDVPALERLLAAGADPAQRGM